MKPYIIGETAYHHEGDMTYLKRMINDLAEIGISSVKFHLLLNPASYMQKKHPLFKATRQFIFPKKVWNKLLDYAVNQDLDIIALCDDIESMKFIIKEHPYVTALELHAASLNDYYLLNKAIDFPGQIILGVGGSTLDEIDYAVNLLRDRNKKDILLMYGFQSYPTSYHDINISKMLKLRDLFELPVGYADHTAYDDENNIYISAMGAAMGINILEKHYTPEPGVKRIDYQSAVGRKDLIKIKNLMQVYLTAYGSGSLVMSEKELIYGNTGPMKKALVARRKIKKGEALSLENLWFKRCNMDSPVKQKELLNIIGLEALRDIEEDEIIEYSNIKYLFKTADYSHLTGGLEEKT